MKCEYCESTIENYYLKVDPYYFNKDELEFKQGIFCDKECFICHLVENGAIWDKQKNSDF